MGPRAALALTLALLLASTGGAVSAAPAGRGQPAQVATTPQVAVQAVLDSRVAALGAGDRARWLDTIDPLAPPGFREAQGRLFEGLRSVPIASYGLEAHLDESGDLSVGLSGRYGAPVFLPETRQRMRLQGYDDRDAVDSLWLTFVLREGRWYIAGDADLADVGLDTARGLWDSGPVRTLAGDHVLVIFHPDAAGRAAALAEIVEEALATLRRRWDQPWSERIPLILPSSTDELERLLQSTIDLDKFLAFVAYSATRDDGWTATAPRIYIQDANLSRISRASQVEALVHELVHAAAAPLTGPNVSAWVHEGVADWVATGRGTVEAKPAGSDSRLPRDYEFAAGTQASIVTAYRESRSATSYLASSVGLGAPTAFFRALGADRVEPGTVDHRVDATIRTITGKSFTDFQADWARR